jgi:hypothetical protein
VNPALIEVTELLENTTADIDVKLRTSLTSIHESDIYPSVTPLDADRPATKWIVVRVAVYIRTVKDNMRYGTDVVSPVIEPAACSQSGFKPG